MTLKNKIIFPLIFVLIFVFLPVFFFTFLLTSNQAYAQNSTDPFPIYPIIRDNVKFWEKVYSIYSTSEAIFHDQDDLTKIYEVVPILDYRIYGSSGKNRQLLKNTKKKYKTILRKLAKGHKPTTKLEKKVAIMYKNASSKTLKNAASNIRIQIGQKNRFKEGVINSGPYMEDIKKVFRAYNLPEDLAYLPHVESSFNIHAYSKHGAAGIWQFTRSTGKTYLRIDYVIDERLDPLLASRAAAQFLKENYQDLQHWPCAITAYNYGPTGMQKAFKKHGSYEAIFKDYDQGHFKFASRNFYPEFIAALKTAKKLEKRKSITQKKRIDTISIKLKGYVSAADVLHHFQINLSTLKHLNPSLRYPVLTGKKYIPKGFNLKLPAKDGAANRIASLPESYYRKNQKRSRFYRVGKGDTASKIALMHNVSLKSLLVANNLKKNDIIYAGEKLRIPALSVQAKPKQSAPVITAQHTKVIKTGEKKNVPNTNEVSSSEPVLKNEKKKTPSL